jgi:hypothetical protein
MAKIFLFKVYQVVNPNLHIELAKILLFLHDKENFDHDN